ncbi:MAG: hypothetical protein KOO62_13280 [candidate division Zixibacteria bacterium]|nr:hypothetical protein [candidate division Zixibacteria bacterium]
MSLTGFLANIGQNFRDHYLRMTNDLYANRTPNHYYNSSPAYDPNSVEVAAPEKDRWEPSSAQPTTDKAVPQEATDTASTTTGADTTPSATDTVPTDVYVLGGDVPSDSGSETPAVIPDGTYTFMRNAHLEYKLDLEFDLAAISRTARYLSGGDTTGVDQLFAGGFGLSADFALKGFEISKSNLPDAEEGAGNLQARGMSHAASRQAGMFQANSRDFALESFFREATNQQRSQNVLVRDGYRRSVNKFAFRFKMDSQFSFANLQRFNVQTRNVAEQMPDSLGKYISTAGDVAQGGTNDMMATFFDSVDAYLNQAEEQLLAKTVGAFEQAAEELGFTGAMVDVARDHLTDSIESFFGRVDTAMSDIRSQFAPGTIPQPEIPTQEPLPMPGTVTDMDRLSEPTQPMQA